MYELIIIGAGPAGITASIYAARKKMNFLIISKDVGGQVLWSADIQNYTGYQFITGPDLTQKFKEHIEQFEIQLKESETVTSIEKQPHNLLVKTDKGEYKSKTLVIASGRTPRKLGVPGEEDFLGKGLAYCATCDGPLFAGLDVAVVGGGNAALDATLQLIKIARKVYVIDIADEFRADQIMLEKARASNKVEFYNSTNVLKVFGDKFVKGLTLSNGTKTFDIKVEGVFIEIGSIPSVEFFPNVAKNESGEIYVNCKCETSISGVFAAGDVTDVAAKQIVVACGEGAKAVLSAFDYLNRI